MLLNYAGYNFELINHIEDIEDKPGVCLILDQVNDEYDLIDIFSSTAIRTKVEKHKNQKLWIKYSIGHLIYALHYTQGLPQKVKAENMEITVTIRREYDLKIPKKPHHAKRPYNTAEKLSEVEE